MKHESYVQFIRENIIEAKDRGPPMKEAVKYKMQPPKRLFSQRSL